MEDKERHPEKIRQPCIMKREMPKRDNEPVDTMVCLNSKVYIADTVSDDGHRKVVKQASKGLQYNGANVVGTANYLNVLNTQQSFTGTNYGFRLMNNRLLQYQQKRTALTYFYCKRIVHSDGIHTSPLDFHEFDD